jgi:hypothetical protein
MNTTYLPRRYKDTGKLGYIKRPRRSYENPEWAAFRRQQYHQHLEKVWEGLDLVHLAVVGVDGSADASRLLEAADAGNVPILAKGKENIRLNRDISAFSLVSGVAELKDIPGRVRQQASRSDGPVERVWSRLADAMVIIQSQPFSGSKAPTTSVAVTPEVALRVFDAAICTATKRIDGTEPWKVKQKDYQAKTETCPWLPELYDGVTDRAHVARFNEAMDMELRCRYVVPLTAAYRACQAEGRSPGRCRFSLTFAIRWSEGGWMPKIVQDTGNPYRCTAYPVEHLVTDDDLASLVAAVWEQTNDPFAFILNERDDDGDPFMFITDAADDDSADHMAA